MNSELILYPIIAMVGLTFAVLIIMARRRAAAVKSRRVDARYYQRYDQGEEPDECRYAARNLANLFETPMLFYVACLVIYVASLVSVYFLLLAWTYVLLRYIHTAVHISINKVVLRFKIFLFSVILLLTIWVSILWQLL